MSRVTSCHARRRAIIAVLALGVVATVATRRRARADGEGRTLVRCRSGHLLRTTRVPRRLLTSLGLGRYRVGYCRVGRHWTLVSPVSDEGVLDHHVHLRVVPDDLAAP